MWFGCDTNDVGIQGMMRMIKNNNHVNNDNVLLFSFYFHPNGMMMINEWWNERGGGWWRIHCCLSLNCKGNWKRWKQRDNVDIHWMWQHCENKRLTK